MRTTDQEIALPRCPRCGYDLAGLTAAWEDSCPLRGVCSECGLDFDWADLLNPARQRLPWLYEHAERWWNARAAWSTLLRLLAPWWFWRRVQPYHAVRPWRLLLWPAAILLSAYLFCSVAFTALVLYRVIAGASVPNFQFPPLHEELVSIWTWPVSDRTVIGSPFGLTSVFLPPIGFVAGMLISVTIARSSRRWATVRPGHLCRLSVYALAWIPALLLVKYVALIWFELAFVYWVTGNAQSQTHALSPPQWLAGFATESGVGVSLLALTWSLLFWWFALRRGLALQRAAAVWLGGAVIGLLLTFLIGVQLPAMSLRL